MNYSNVICIGDSFTNEWECYRREGLLEKFDEMGYEFKSYPQILGEKYNCEWETFGQPGMTLPFTIMTLIDKIDYILSLENPLVIFQFGFFQNSTLKVDDNIEFIWKDFGGTYEDDAVINAQDKNNFIDGLDISDKLAITTWYEKYEEFRNYWYIDEFTTIARMINRMKKIDMFGMFLSVPKFNLPKNEHLLYLFGGAAFNEHIERIDHLDGITDHHKSTRGNEKLADEITKAIREHDQWKKDNNL